MASLDLIAVVSGAAYERYADDLFVSAREHLQPRCDVRMVMLAGKPGWPDATLYRYHAIVEHVDSLRGDWLFLCDADMRFEEAVGDEILGDLVATLHPGYVARGFADLPFETRPESAAYVYRRRGNRYYAGGFVGGTRAAFFDLAVSIAQRIDEDDKRGIVARWHDESHLNRVLTVTPPTLTLSPAFCHPDDDRAYLATWPERYPRKLVALDKSPAERGSR